MGTYKLQFTLVAGHLIGQWVLCQRIEKLRKIPTVTFQRLCKGTDSKKIFQCYSMLM